MTDHTSARKQARTYGVYAGDLGHPGGRPVTEVGLAEVRQADVYRGPEEDREVAALRERARANGGTRSLAPSVFEALLIEKARSLGLDADAARRALAPAR